MNRALAVLILITGLGLASCATMGPGTSTQISAGVDITSAPPPPVVTYSANFQWRYVSGIWVPSDDSYQYDMFRYGTWVYLYTDGYWYRSSNYGGPYVVIETRRVPHQIFELNDRDYHWRNRPQAWRPGNHGHDRDRDRD